MDTSTLERYVEEDCRISKLLGGVLPKDLLPPPSSSVKLFIVNLDTSKKPGSHWIALLITTSYLCEYFDPLGNNMDDFIKDYFKVHSLTVLYNTKQCQNSTSTSCGKFCLFYCFLKARCTTFQEILNYFKDNTIYNETLVEEFYLLTS